MEAPLEAPGACDSRSPARALRSPHQQPHRRPVEELVRTILSQNTTDTNRDVAFARLRSASRPGRRSATRRSRRSRRRSALAAWRRRRPANPGGAARASTTTSIQLAGERPEGGGTRVPHLAAGRRTKDGGLRVDLLLRLPGDPGRHARVSRRRSARPAAAQGLVRRPDEMRAVIDPSDAYELHINLIEARTRHLPAAPALRRMRAAAGVPILEATRDPGCAMRTEFKSRLSGAVTETGLVHDRSEAGDPPLGDRASVRPGPAPRSGT